MCKKLNLFGDAMFSVSPPHFSITFVTFFGIGQNVIAIFRNRNYRILCLMFRHVLLHAFVLSERINSFVLSVIDAGVVLSVICYCILRCMAMFYVLVINN